MNIFYVDRNPETCATNLGDKHVIKMTLETAQLLCGIFPNGEAPYRRTHYNHPCAVWLRQSKAQYDWLVKHGLALADEYTLRYGKEHKSKSVILWCKEKIETYNNWPSLFSFNDPPLCMPDDCKVGDAVLSYREYYKKHKTNLHNWKGRGEPEWLLT